MNTNLVEQDENMDDFFGSTLFNGNMKERYVPKTHTPPEILYHERISLIDAIKSELSEDTVEFLDYLVSFPQEEFFALFCTRSGKPTQASIAKTCIKLGLSRKKVRRFFAELFVMYQLL